LKNNKYLLPLWLNNNSKTENHGKRNQSKTKVEQNAFGSNYTCGNRLIDLYDYG
jgi:hypothetical protein